MAASKRPDNPFWEFSLAHYSRREVAEACLHLQDAYGVNINLLLFCCWAGSRGEKLNTTQILKAQRVIAEWDTQVVQRLRQLRRYLKDSAFTVGQIEKSVRELELSAERVVQDMLADWWLGEPSANALTCDQEILGVQKANLELFLSQAGAPSLVNQSPLLWPLNRPHFSA